MHPMETRHRFALVQGSHFTAKKGVEVSPRPPDPRSYMFPPPRGCVLTENEALGAGLRDVVSALRGALTREGSWIPEWERFQRKTQAESHRNSSCILCPTLCQR